MSNLTTDLTARLADTGQSGLKTSFNWLSFRGDSNRKFRQEEGDLVSDQVLADRAYDRYMRENCALALEIVGTLPERYRTYVNPASSTTGPPPSSPHAMSPPRQSRAERKREALKSLSVGEVVSGTVKTITNFGAFVDLGEVDGLVHISQLADRRVDHPSDVVSVGDAVTVLVQDVDLDRERVSLSLRAVPQ